MQEAVTEPETHRVSIQPRPCRLPRGDQRLLPRRFDVELDPASEIIPAIGRQGGDLQPQPRLSEPRRRRSSPPIPATPSIPPAPCSPAPIRSRCRSCRTRLRRPTSRRSPPSRPRAGAADVSSTTPTTPPARSLPGLLRARRGVRPRARHPRRARQLLLGDRLRRPPPGLVPRPPPAPRRSGSRSSRSPRATT